MIDISLCSLHSSHPCVSDVTPPLRACRHPCSGLREALGDYCSLEAAELMWGSRWHRLADSGGGRLVTEPYRLISPDVQQGGERC